LATPTGIVQQQEIAKEVYVSCAQRKNGPSFAGLQRICSMKATTSHRIMAEEEAPNGALRILNINIGPTHACGRVHFPLDFPLETERSMMFSLFFLSFFPRTHTQGLWGTWTVAKRRSRVRFLPRFPLLVSISIRRARSLQMHS